MSTKKGGSILINLETKKIGLVYRDELDDYSFPKGHLEEGESLLECAIRETEEETLRKCHPIFEKEIEIMNYSTPSGEDCEVYYYILVDDGETDKQIAPEDIENLRWAGINEVASLLSYTNLIDFWNRIKDSINVIINSKGTVIPFDL